ncbi:hypothetical protein [Desulfosporosinus shakirovi]|uniref:hypothetical protein n=1 Tax=Desulfosporosinus shakirovi TaxID=2885154 RepID=UPI001E508814|nr:hypothetical protein [Desulfosporosinus sp. SRJS8]MCB8814687.1 hypothetical protein [Desulfosporosinus sp. SRJS8]
MQRVCIAVSCHCGKICRQPCVVRVFLLTKIFTCSWYNDIVQLINKAVKVSLIIWGPSAKLLTEDQPLQEYAAKIKQAGVEVLAF